MIRAFGQTQLHSYREGRPPDVTRMSETKLKIGCFLCLCLKECRHWVDGYGMPPLDMAYPTSPVLEEHVVCFVVCVWKIERN